MLEVKTNRQIKYIKTEVFMGFSIREIFIFGIVMVFGGYLFIAVNLPPIVLAFILSPVVLVATLLAVARPCGMPPEKFIFAALKGLIFNNRKLKVKNTYTEEVLTGVIKGNRKKRLRKGKDTKNSL